MAEIYVPGQENLGRRRFPDNKGFRKSLYNKSVNILSQLQGLLPSNYPKPTYDTNIAIFNRVMAREFARLRSDIDFLNADAQYTQTRIEYLQQILGERLFLGDQIAPALYNDESYREYLIAIKNAYLRGSKKENIEDLASEFTGQQINIRELYLEARDPSSSLDVSDTHKMVVDVLIDDMLRAGYNINILKRELDFFINLVRPAHVIYDTRLIWTEQIDVNKIHDIYFGDTGGGCIPTYIFDSFEEPTILATQIFVLSTSEGATGEIDSIHHDDLIFYFTDSTRIITEPGTNGTKIYNENGKQVPFNYLKIGQYVRVVSQIIPGDFQFWYYPSEILTTWSSQFYKNIYRLPLFQEYVKKEMDQNGRFPLQTKTTTTTVCDRWVHDTLTPFYEDLRHSCTEGYETDATYSVTLHNKMGMPHLSWPFPSDEIHDDLLFGSDFIYFMENTPLTDGSGNPATISDVSVSLDGTALSTQPLISVDASTGRVTITDSTTYWDGSTNPYPIPGNELTFSYHYLQDSTNYDTTSSQVYGVAFWQMPYAPLVNGDGSGILADTTDIDLTIDGTYITGPVSELRPLFGHVILNQSSDFWNNSELGHLPQVDSTFHFDFSYGHNYTYTEILDDPGRLMDQYGSNVTYNIVHDSEYNEPLYENVDYDYSLGGIDSSSSLAFPYSLGINWQLPKIPIIANSLSIFINNINISDPISVFDASSGFISLKTSEEYWNSSELGRLPRITTYVDSTYINGDVFEFRYSYSKNTGYDSEYYNFDKYPYLTDSTSIIGYRYRAYQLHHSSILNSPDTLLLNNFQKPAKRASIINQADTLNHFNIFFSPEFLYDSSSDIIFNDKYLTNGLNPVLKLNEGTPPFQKTFGYHEGLVYQKKLQDIRRNHELLMYSDLLIKEFEEGGDTPISPICDSNRLSFKIRYDGDTIPPLEECPEWILFDSVQLKTEQVDIPGELVGVPNLRVSGMLLRDSFILRELEPSGTAVFTYETQTPYNEDPPVQFNLPTSFLLDHDGTYVDFPTLPIVDQSGSLATVLDIDVTVDGTSWTVVALDPINGVVELNSYPETTVIEEEHIITATEAASHRIKLNGYITDPTGVTITPIYGTAQYLNEDFVIEGRYISWLGGPLHDIITAGDRIRLSYTINPFIDVPVIFTYRIRNSALIEMFDDNYTRITDNGYVMAGYCYDGYSTTLSTSFDEYMTVLDDYSDGIKIIFFNTSTYQLEEHIFSGPVFEYHEVSKDELGSPDNFPNALVRLRNSNDNPLNFIGDYSFINDKVVRFRKKTFKELLPSNVFRTIELTEMLPI